MAAVVAAAGIRALARPSQEEALALLAARDCERSERLALVEAVLDGARDGLGPGALLPAAMACLVLGDRPGYDACCRELGTDLPVRPGDESRIEMASLGEPLLQHLLLGIRSEVAGRPKEARRNYQIAIDLGDRWDLPCAAALAAERLSGIR
ncbi:MAG: hypothetical protein Fur0037_12800 [Planctomycetota bacterium]